MKKIIKRFVAGIMACSMILPNVLVSSAAEENSYSRTVGNITVTTHVGDPYEVNREPNNISGINGGTYTFVSPALGGGGISRDWKMSLNGSIALCADYGKSFKSGLNYELIENASIPWYVGKALNFAATGSNREAAQVYVWAKGNETLFKRAYLEYLISGTNSGSPKFSYSEVASWGDNEITLHNMGNRYANWETAQAWYDSISSYSSNTSGIKMFGCVNGNSFQKIYSKARNSETVVMARDVWSEGTGYDFANPKFTQNLTVHKTSDVNGEDLSGAEFKVENISATNGASVNMSLANTITTKSNGTGSLDRNINITLPELASDVQTVRHNFDFTYRYNVNDGDPLSYKTGDAYEAVFNQVYNEVQSKINADLNAKSSNAIANTSVTYKLTEEKAPAGYEISEAPRTITMTGATTADMNVLDFTNEAWKSKLNIVKKDAFFDQLIYADTKFDIFEWNGSDYELSKNYSVIRREDGTYTVKSSYANAEEGYLYYSQKNAGKFRIIESKAAYGFFGDFDENDKKINHDIELTKELDGEEIKAFKYVDGKNE